ncbi:MAG: hypothetical protein Q8R72_06205 [Hylemonella sp.]|nr:hypothetical protein [Hylemonella sp.]
MKLLPNLVAVTLLALSLPAPAQKVYRCGNSYSQVPCPDGQAIDAADSRTPEQRKAHDASVRHEKRNADTLEKTRLKDEAAAVRAAEHADKAERAAEKEKQKSAANKNPAASGKDKLPAYRAPVTSK